MLRVVAARSRPDQAAGGASARSSAARVFFSGVVQMCSVGVGKEALRPGPCRWPALGRVLAGGRRAGCGGPHARMGARSRGHAFFCGVVARGAYLYKLRFWAGARARGARARGQCRGILVGWPGSGGRDGAPGTGGGVGAYVPEHGAWGNVPEPGAWALRCAGAWEARCRAAWVGRGQGAPGDRHKLWAVAPRRSAPQLIVLLFFFPLPSLSLCCLYCAARLVASWSAL